MYSRLPNAANGEMVRTNGWWVVGDGNGFAQGEGCHPEPTTHDSPPVIILRR